MIVRVFGEIRCIDTKYGSVYVSLRNNDNKNTKENNNYDEKRLNPNKKFSEIPVPEIGIITYYFRVRPAYCITFGRYIYRNFRIIGRRCDLGT